MLYPVISILVFRLVLHTSDNDDCFNCLVLYGIALRERKGELFASKDFLEVKDLHAVIVGRGTSRLRRASTSDAN